MTTASTEWSHWVVNEANSSRRRCPRRSDETIEPDKIRERYHRRQVNDSRYSLLQPSTLLGVQERQRVIASMMRKAGMTDLAEISVLEIGCGAGGNLTEFIRMGLDPARMTGIELLDDRLQQARERLPGSVMLIVGDAAQQPAAPESQSIVMLSTVMSSVLDDAFQERLAAVAWAAVKPGGALLWYDFAYNNPRNPDVRGVPFRRVRALFPEATITKRRVTLAPPIARRVTAVHPFFYTVFNAVPLIRSHLVCWLAKPAG